MQENILMRSMHFRLDLRGLLLVILVSGWLVGIVIDAWLPLTPFVLLLGGGCALILGIICWHLPILRLSALVGLCLCLGAWRYTTVTPLNDPRAVDALIGQRTLQIQGEVADEPRLESASTLITVNVQSVSLNQGQSWQEVDGQIQVQALGASFDDPYAPRYGDTLQLAGKLSAPPAYATPEFQASMTFPSISIVKRGGNPFLLFLYQVRNTLAGILLQALPQPYAALLIAIFLSLRTPALKPLLFAFNVTGTAHLIAPSGFKVTLLAGLISSSTRWLMPRQTSQDQYPLPAERHRGDWRRWLHTLLLMFCIVCYTLLSGAGPAAIRAGLMGILLVLAPRLQRAYNVYTALALTALVMSLVNPFVLWDSGFLLSFTGTLGIVLLTPTFQYALRFLAHLPMGFHIAEIIAVTLAAQIATLPLLALNFNEISFIALFANLATVPLLSTLLALSMLLCACGLIALPLALLCGWLAWPLLWYIATTISWCAQLPGAYLTVDHLSPLIAWLYYGLLGWLILLLCTRWRPASHQQPEMSTKGLRRMRILLQCAMALLLLLSTSLLAQAAPAKSDLTITLLSTDTPDQGQALFLRTAGGQTVLIDEGANNTVLDQTLDAHLPFWQRSLNLLILSDTSPDNLAGLQDVITRYQIQRVVDSGMLHPTLAYARWRTTLATRGLAYTQVRQGAQIALDPQTTLQVLWPPAHLHKSSDETRDNALILRLLTPGRSILLLNSAALSTYALQMLTLEIVPSLIQAQTVQVSGEMGKVFPGILRNVLAMAQPSFVLLTLAPDKQHTKTDQATIATTPSLPPGPWEVLQGEQAGSLQLQAAGAGWNINPSG